MATSRRNWVRKLAGASLGAIATQFVISVDYARGQIAPDNTLGAESSVVTPNVDIKGIQSDRIDGGAIRGANLFIVFENSTLVKEEEPISRILMRFKIF